MIRRVMVQHNARRWDEAGWVALMAGATVLCSFAFACATPFVALATIAAARMEFGAGLLCVLLAFIGNQAIGFGLLHYPLDWTCYGWGAAIGAAALVGYAAAYGLSRFRLGAALSVLAAFAVAFTSYEATLYVAGLALGSTGGAFAPRVVLRVLEINAGALAALLALRAVGAPSGLCSSGRAAAADQTAR